MKGRKGDGKDKNKKKKKKRKERLVSIYAPTGRRRKQDLTHLTHGPMAWGVYGQWRSGKPSPIIGLFQLVKLRGSFFLSCSLLAMFVSLLLFAHGDFYSKEKEKKS